MSVMTTAGFFAIMVVAVSLILGQAGQLSLGHNAFYGIGAYVAAILATTYHWNTLLALVTGALASGLVALIIGKPVLKLKYFYLALATLGLGQIFVIVVTAARHHRAAPTASGRIPSLSIFGFEVSTYMRQYYVVWIVVILILLFTDRALKYRVRPLAAVAGDERDRRIDAGRAHRQLEARRLRRRRRLLRPRRRAVRLRQRGDHARVLRVRRRGAAGGHDARRRRPVHLGRDHRSHRAHVGGQRLPAARRSTAASPTRSS